MHPRSIEELQKEINRLNLEVKQLRHDLQTSNRIIDMLVAAGHVSVRKITLAKEIILGLP